MTPETELYEEIIEVCCHRVKIFWDMDEVENLSEDEKTDLADRLNEAAEERAKECIADGCPQGQLCTAWSDNAEKVHEFYGWYKIESIA